MNSADVTSLEALAKKATDLRAAAEIELLQRRMDHVALMALGTAYATERSLWTLVTEARDAMDIERASGPGVATC